MFECKCPEVGGDSVGPMGHSMQEHGLSMGSDNANVVLGKTILPVGTDAAK